MNHPKLIKAKRGLGQKLTVLVLLAVTGMGAFASLGDGGKKSTTGSPAKLLSSKTPNTPGSFSLRSGYSYRGSQVMNTQSERRVIRLNTVVTMQRGNTTYIVPLKKNVFLGNVKIDIGNRQFKRN